MIGSSVEVIQAAVHGAIGDRAHTLEPSHESAKGTYVSMVLSLDVQSESDRLQIHSALHDHPDVRYVL